MPQLDRATYLEILDLLYPLTQTGDERANLLTVAFADYEIARIDVRSGTQDVALHRMISKLVDYGTIGDKTALWILLEYILQSDLLGTDTSPCS